MCSSIKNVCGTFFCSTKSRQNAAKCLHGCFSISMVLTTNQFQNISSSHKDTPSYSAQIPSLWQPLIDLLSARFCLHSVSRKWIHTEHGHCLLSMTSLSWSDQADLLTANESRRSVYPLSSLLSHAISSFSIQQLLHCQISQDSLDRFKTMQMIRPFLEATVHLDCSHFNKIQDPNLSSNLKVRF